MVAEKKKKDTTPKKHRDALIVMRKTILSLGGNHDEVAALEKTSTTQLIRDLTNDVRELVGANEQLNRARRAVEGAIKAHDPDVDWQEPAAFSADFLFGRVVELAADSAKWRRMHDECRAILDDFFDRVVELADQYGSPWVVHGRRPKQVDATATGVVAQLIEHTLRKYKLTLNSLADSLVHATPDRE